MTIQPIETRYAGCRFRSRLEARWAVFFDALSIRWEYEPQGYLIPREDGSRTPYLPDFLLTECGTWVEVKGSEVDLNPALIEDAVYHLASVPVERLGSCGPTLMLLGPIPDPPSKSCDLGWLGLSAASDEHTHWASEGYGWPQRCSDFYYGFGGFPDLRAPEELDISGATNYAFGGSWLEPCTSYQSMNSYPGVPDAYRAARGARFEHGETP